MKRSRKKQVARKGSLISNPRKLLLNDKQGRKLKILVISVLASSILLSFLGDFAIMVIMFPIGIFLGYWSTILSKFIPHITLETMSIMSITLGLVYGPKYAFIFGFGVAMSVYVLLSLIKLTTILNSIVIGLGGVFAGFFIKISVFDPKTTFMICLLVRAVVGIVMFWKITSDKVEALAHAIVDPVFNIFIYMPLFYLLYQALLLI